jgi:SAM-dependent methyltransferase
MEILILFFVISVIVVILFATLWAKKVIKGGFTANGGGYRNILVIDATEGGPDSKVKYIDDIDDKEEVYDTLGDLYVDVASNFQIGQIIGRGCFDDMARLIDLLGKFVNKVPGRDQSTNEKFHFLVKLLDNYDGDSKLYDKLIHTSTGLVRTKLVEKGEEIYRNIKDYLSGPVVSLLGIGRRNKELFDALGALVGAKKIEYMDMRPEASWSHSEVSPLPVDTVGPTLEINGQYDLIVVDMVLHHIEDIDKTSANLADSLANGGLLFIKEHDVWDAFDQMIADIEHSLYARINGEDMSNYYCKCKNYFAWDDIFVAKCGLEYVKGNFYYASIKNRITPSRAHYTIYRKALK